MCYNLHNCSCPPVWLWAWAWACAAPMWVRVTPPPSWPLLMHLTTCLFLWGDCQALPVACLLHLGSYISFSFVFLWPDPKSWHAIQLLSAWHPIHIHSTPTNSHTHADTRRWEWIGPFDGAEVQSSKCNAAPTANCRQEHNTQRLKLALTVWLSEWVTWQQCERVSVRVCIRVVLVIVVCTAWAIANANGLIDHLFELFTSA